MDRGTQIANGSRFKVLRPVRHQMHDACHEQLEGQLVPMFGAQFVDARQQGRLETSRKKKKEDEEENGDYVDNKTNKLRHT